MCVNVQEHAVVAIERRERERGGGGGLPGRKLCHINIVLFPDEINVLHCTTYFHLYFLKSHYDFLRVLISFKYLISVSSLRFLSKFCKIFFKISTIILVKYLLRYTTIGQVISFSFLIRLA